MLILRLLLLVAGMAAVVSRRLKTVVETWLYRWNKLNRRDIGAKSDLYTVIIFKSDGLYISPGRGYHPGGGSDQRVDYRT